MGGDHFDYPTGDLMLERPIVLTPRADGDGWRAEFAAVPVADEPVGMGSTKYGAVIDLLMQIHEPPVTP